MSCASLGRESQVGACPACRASRGATAGGDHGGSTSADRSVDAARWDVRQEHLSSLRDWWIAWALSFLGLTSEANTCRRSATGDSFRNRDAMPCRRSATGGSFRNREAMSCASLGRESQVGACPAHRASREATAGGDHGGSTSADRSVDAARWDVRQEHLSSLRDWWIAWALCSSD